MHSKTVERVTLDVVLLATHKLRGVLRYIAQGLGIVTSLKEGLGHDTHQIVAYLVSCAI